VEKYCTAGQTTDDNTAHQIAYLRKVTHTLSEYITLDTVNFVVAIFFVEIYIYIYIYTGFPGRNVPDFGRMFLKLK